MNFQEEDQPSLGDLGLEYCRELSLQMGEHTENFAKGSRVVVLPKALWIDVERMRKTLFVTPPVHNALLCDNRLAKKIIWNMMSWICHVKLHKVPGYFHENWLQLLTWKKLTEWEH